MSESALNCYVKIQKDLARKFKQRQIDFLEYQGFAYQAIDRTIQKYQKELKQEKSLKFARVQLETSWAEGDPMVADMLVQRYGVAIEVRREKLKLIGKQLAQKYRNQAAREVRKELATHQDTRGKE